MMRGFFIASILLSLAYFIAAMITIAGITEARRTGTYETQRRYMENDGSPGTYGGIPSSYEDVAQEETWCAVVISVVYFLLMEAVFLAGLVKIKTQTMKIFSIIGMSLAGFFLACSFLPLNNPVSEPFDQVVPALMIASVVFLAFSIIGTVHAFKTKT
ncbi:MAG TPA: hypothetical protein VFU15_16615 [Bacteroidia bacterium]|nr:hypothetical protein [Bacteroidia bacterium]